MRRLLVAVALVAGLLTPVLVSAPPATAATVPVKVGFGGRGLGIPANFFGLSVEYNELAQYEKSGTPVDNVLNLLRSSARGPLTLRIGGKSADHMLWEPKPLSAAALKHQPYGVFQLGPSWVTSLQQLVDRDNLRIVLNLNLAVHSPTMAVNFARAVRHALPAGHLAALEIGNEPDMYHFQKPLTQERVDSTIKSTPLHWWYDYTNLDYRRDYLTYARALERGVPGMKLGAPDITRPMAPWLTELTGLGKLRPGFLAIHRYGASGCFAPTSSAYPTVSNMLNDANSAGLAASVASWAHYAHRHHMGLRVSEINSVSCGNDAHVANSFATALWAPDTLFSMIKAGVDAVSWHFRPKHINAPFLLGKGGGVTAQPELYGLALFSAMVRGRSRLIGSSVSSTPKVHLKAWVVRNGRTVRVLLLNKGPQALQVSLKALSGVSEASVRRLTAPGVHATGGVRFGGQRIGSDGLWEGVPVVQQVRSSGGHYHLHVDPYSAAFVTL